MRARVVDATSSRFADFAAKRGAAAVFEANAGQVGGDQRFGDALELGVVLGRKARPIRCISTTSAATLAIEDGNLVDVRRRTGLSGQVKQRRAGGGATEVLRQGYYFFLVLRVGASAGVLNRSVATSTGAFCGGLAGFAVAGDPAGWSLGANFMAMYQSSLEKRDDGAFGLRKRPISAETAVMFISSGDHIPAASM